MELANRVPNLGLICNFLNNYDILNGLDIIYEILCKFKLNEDIASSSLRLLCKSAREPVDTRLVSLLESYSALEMNENLRYIAMQSLRHIKSDLLKFFPQSIISLLLDDTDELRNEACRLLNPSSPFNPSESLSRFINSNGMNSFIEFLNRHENSHSFISNRANQTCLFEKEPLNLFIDLHFLRKKFILPREQKN